MAELSVACTGTPFWYFSGVPRSALAQDTTVARTIRFPASLRERIANDAERCGRSFEGQVLALLRRHYGEDVDIAPNPNDILALATASLADVPASEARALVRRLKEAER
jgi:predicted nucleic acid-binding protein